MNHDNQAPAAFWRSPPGIALFVALAVVGFYLVTEHRAHLLGVVPYLFLLACPLMHVFMHGHHGAHGSSRHSEADDEKRRQ